MKKYYKHPITKRIKEIDSGFNWCAFLFGVFYYGYKGMLGKGILYMIIALVLGSFTFFIGAILVWLVAGFKFNEEYENHLVKEGYRRGK